MTTTPAEKATAGLELALSLLSLIANRTDTYREMNSAIAKVQVDFPTRLQAIDSPIETAVLKLLDAIVGEELASYWLYLDNAINFLTGERRKP